MVSYRSHNPTRSAPHGRLNTPRDDKEQQDMIF